MNKLWIGFVIGLILIGSGVFLMFSSPTITGNTVENGASDVKTFVVATFVVTGQNFRFFMNDVENPDITVKQGDTVRIEFTSTEGFHDWVVDEFSAATERVSSGDSTFVEFVASEKGVFEYYCSVGEHRANGMNGRFIVE